MQSELKLDERSEGVIKTLHPSVRQKAREFVYNTNLYLRELESDCEVKLISGTRSYSEQDELYAKGRTKPGKIVTMARGGYSNHNFGIAFDIGLFSGRKYIDESPLYRELGIVGERLGLEWGGRWTRFVDEPHFQMRPKWAERMKEGEMIAQMRKMAAHNQDIFA